MLHASRYRNIGLLKSFWKLSTTVVLLLPRACRLSRQQFLASMKSLLLCIEMLDLSNSKHMQHMQNDREYCSLVTIFVSWNFGWGPSLLKSTGVSGFQCERGREKCMIYSMDSVLLAEILGTTMLLFGWERRITKTLSLFRAITSILRISNKKVRDSVDCWSKLARSASWYINQSRMIGMMSSRYQEADDYSMCFHVCNYHRPRIGRNLPTKRVPGNFVSESRHIQLCQNLRCFFLDDEQQLVGGLWYWIPVFRSNETADLPKQSTAKRTASKIKSLLYGQGLVSLQSNWQ